MHLPALRDTILAISSGWHPAPLAIVRLAGPDAFALTTVLGVSLPDPAGARGWPCWTATRLSLEPNLELPACVYWFRAPRSYTGQDLVELHTVGSLPLLRLLSARLIEHGARRALPGEFTARAYLARRLDAGQVEGVLALIQAEHAADLRQAARLTRGAVRTALAQTAELITDLLARIEAGIDFVDEEDIRFVTAAEVRTVLDDLLARLAQAAGTPAAGPRAGRPHIALVGLPNAGKSTLFNALLGYERALVSPVLGTTRDVLSAEVHLGGVPAVLQDCAGLGASVAELELASYIATERAAEHADLVLWVHAADMPWDPRETAACQHLSPDRRMLIWTKTDLLPSAAVSPLDFVETQAVSAANATGLSALRAALARYLAMSASGSSETHQAERFRAAAAALQRARELVALPDQAPVVASDPAVPAPELVALELRSALAALHEDGARVDEAVLGRIFAQFCVGK